ncbi:UNVERIFIED_CONTAM: hypothetical protein BEN50_13205 [Euhalothece sp. KZN 001]
MLELNQEQSPTKLKMVRSWKSFEEFRKAGAKALEPIKNGSIATLKTGTGNYRVISEEDFQKLYGLACDVDRLQGGLSVVLTAARAVQKHNDPETVQVLVQTIKMMGNLSALPTRQEFDHPQLETSDSEIEADDEIIDDPSLLERPV